MSGKQLTPVVVPRVNVNEDSVTISWIAVKPGTKVALGDVLFTMATSKADVEVAAEAAGHYWPAVDAGTVVDVGAVVGYLSDSAEAPASIPKPAAAGPGMLVQVETQPLSLGFPRASSKLPLIN